MALLCCNGGVLQCTFGMTPSIFTVLPQHRVTTTFMPDANILDHIPLVNIQPFGMCSAPTNPAVIAATAAASGVPTPAPCVPVVPAPWVPGSTTVLLDNAPALNDQCRCFCTWLGVISFTFAGEVTVQVPPV